MNTPIAMPTLKAPGGQHDFDFLHGHWKVLNRRLRLRLCGCTDWESFEATQYCMPWLDGLVNVDEMRNAAGPVGLSLRLFDLGSLQWRIHWVSPRDGVLQPAVQGCFIKGMGLFEGPDEHEGRPIQVRFVWSGTDSRTPRWEQAFSDDDGQTWETNWVMDFTLLAA